MSRDNVEKRLMLKELQMLSGVVTEDYDYLIYLLLKGGSFFSMGNKALLYKSTEEKEITLDKWFRSIRSWV